MHDGFFGAMLTVFLLGVRHGFDADHLAAIDGLTRLSSDMTPRARRALCGLWFSVGHGVVIVTIAASVNLLVSAWTPPDWLEPVGRWTSIAMLVTLGAASVRLALRTNVESPAMGGALMARLRRLWGGGSPWGIGAVGALFAVSFDTVSQAVLFGSAALTRGGLVAAITFGLVFTLGMAVTDALNSWWISHLIHRTQDGARSAARVFTGVIGVVSVLVGIAGALQLILYADDQSLPQWGVALSVVSVVLVFSGYSAAQSLGKRWH
jgi:high-affinity nickel-transport protein